VKPKNLYHRTIMTNYQQIEDLKYEVTRLNKLVRILVKNVPEGYDNEIKQLLLSKEDEEKQSSENIIKMIKEEIKRLVMKEQYDKIIELNVILKLKTSNRMKKELEKEFDHLLENKGSQTTNS